MLLFWHLLFFRAESQIIAKSIMYEFIPFLPVFLPYFFEDDLIFVHYLTFVHKTHVFQKFPFEEVYYSNYNRLRYRDINEHV